MPVAMCKNSSRGFEDEGITTKGVVLVMLGNVIPASANALAVGLLLVAHTTLLNQFTATVGRAGVTNFFT